MWRENGYELMTISVWCSAHTRGYMQPTAESNCYFTPRANLEKIGYADTRFTHEGGGALNLHIFLDDVSAFNGPLWFIKGSHRQGPVPAALDVETTSYPLWCVDKDTVAGLVEAGDIVSAEGPAGSMLIFGDLLVHGSPPNMSPWDRRIYSLILNPVANASTKQGRAEHQHHRDLTPVEALEDNCLMVATAEAV